MTELLRADHVLHRLHRLDLILMHRLSKQLCAQARLVRDVDAVRCLEPMLPDRLGFSCVDGCRLSPRILRFTLLPSA